MSILLTSDLKLHSVVCQRPQPELHSRSSLVGKKNLPRGGKKNLVTADNTLAATPTSSFNESMEVNIPQELLWLCSIHFWIKASIID